MDLAKGSKFSFKFSKSLIKFLLYLPGLWLTFHIFRLAFTNVQNLSSSKDLWNTETNLFLIEEFKKYRNFFYLLYVGVLVIFGILIMVKGVKHFTGQKLEKPKSSFGYEYILPAVIQGLILVTFSYAISGFLLDAFLILKNLFNNT